MKNAKKPIDDAAAMYRYGHDEAKARLARIGELLDVHAQRTAGVGTARYDLAADLGRVNELLRQVEAFIPR